MKLDSTTLRDTSLHKCILYYHILCRLKAAQGSKTMTSLLALGCQRRILLTGTPVQNNLDEFFGKSTHMLQVWPHMWSYSAVQAFDDCRSCSGSVTDTFLNDMSHSPACQYCTASKMVGDCLH